MEKLSDGAKKLGLSFTPKQAEQFQVYYEELVSWNKRVNLTAITDYEQVQIKHFLDSLTVTLALEGVKWAPRAEFHLLDVGAGGGLPGIPLKIIFPKVKLVLLDSVAKKTTFLHYLVGRLELSEVEILTGRAENIAHQKNFREQFDLVVSRAVGKLPTTTELSLPFCQIDGCFVASKKGRIEQEINQALNSITILGGKLREVKKVELEQLEQRCLVIVDKVSPTPQLYPRRPGVPQHHPL
jgi:16S rRNA (guanine527-N7)-methyltransferase